MGRRYHAYQAWGRVLTAQEVQACVAECDPQTQARLRHLASLLQAQLPKQFGEDSAWILLGALAKAGLDGERPPTKEFMKRVRGEYERTQAA